ncbi:uncharacterized protein V6R79_026082 [Siganus canaliculatus]
MDRVFILNVCIKTRLLLDLTNNPEKSDSALPAAVILNNISQMAATKVELSTRVDLQDDTHT